MFGLGSTKVRAVAFDVIGTSFPLDPLRPGIIALGLPPSGLEGWFAAALRDAFGLAAAGDFQPFKKVLASALDGILAEQGVLPSTAEKHALLEGMTTLEPRSGLGEAMALVRDRGLPVLALTNGSLESAEALLTRAGLEQSVDEIVSVDEVKRSKPAADVYLRASAVAGVKPGELALVAAHAWDVNGAAAAGLQTSYLSADRPFSPVMRKPDVEEASLVACVRGLLGTG